jgi:hypothetical protein
LKTPGLLYQGVCGGGQDDFPPKNEIDERLTQINSYVLNVGLGIAMLITMLFCIGSLDSVLNSPAPYLQLFNNTGKTGISLLLNIILFLLIFSGNITVSRSRHIGIPP